MSKHSSQIMEFARRGADHRYEELKAEIGALIKQFPHLKAPGRRTKIDVSLEPAALIDPPRKRRKMSAAARRKISLAQKRRWAKHRAVHRG